jgi:ankyrin repeat protein
VQQALQNGANVNCYSENHDDTPLTSACERGNDDIVRILLDAGVDPWRISYGGASAMRNAVEGGHLSIVELLINHDKGLLEIEDSFEQTPLMFAINHRLFGIVPFLLDRGANALATNDDESTTLMAACREGANLEIVQRLLAAGVDVEECDESHATALHGAAISGSIDVVRELIVEHNANMYAVDYNEETPFDWVPSSFAAGDIQAFLIECYSTTVHQEHDRLALHAILAAADYSFAVDDEFHPPLNPLRIRLPLGKLTLDHFRTLLSTLGMESIRDRDNTRKLPIHFACRSKVPVEVLSLLTEMDPTTLQLADDSGALPIHSLFCCDHPTEYASVRYLVEQGGVGTLAARNRDGALPLHVLCGSQNPSLRTVQFMIQSSTGSVAAQTNFGQYPFMIAAHSSSTASLSVVYELVRTIPGLINSK